MIAPSSITVAVPGGSYSVAIGAGLLDRIGETVRGLTGVRRCALVSDSSVAPLYAPRVEAALRGTGVEPVLFVVPAGEPSKSWSEAGRLLEAFSDAGMGRDSLVVALGGGVVGDLAGFCAATYLRGVPVLHAPTTLLAQADSAIGGKTGVDLPRGKNLAGSFWQPIGVLADTGCLTTLPEREWRSGLAEVVKSAVLDSGDAFDALEGDAQALSARDPDVTERAVRMAAALKSRVVSGDERESADRECLNLGHTLAHAIERERGYGTVAHGAAVADGMRFAARLAETMGVADEAWGRRQALLLDALGLTRSSGSCEPEELLAAMRSDKKVRSGRVRFILSASPGEWRAEPVDDAVLLDALREWCRSDTGGIA